jgi:hypothetical protein
VLKAQSSLHWDLGETNGTVALRVPDHEIALELLGDIGPMAVTSANTTGDPAARTVTEAQSMLGESVAVYLDGGPAAEGEASTIVDCTGEAAVTLRLGAIPQERIDEVLAPAADDLEPAADSDLQHDTQPDEASTADADPSFWLDDTPQPAVDVASADGADTTADVDAPARTTAGPENGTTPTQ